jgi:hypothetical protein
MTLKERFLKIKAAFDGTPPPPPAPAPAPAATTSCGYAVNNGSPVYVDISDDGMPDIDVNDKVYTDSAMTTPYPDGTYTVTGSDFVFTVTGGVVASVNDPDGKGPGTPIDDGMAKPPAAPPAAPTPPAPAATPPQPVTLAEMTPEQVTAMYLKFATGTPEERLTGLEIMVKALMECNFGYKIREGNENQAIQVYKDTVGTPTAQITAMQSAFAKIDEQAKTITKLEGTITSLLELTGQLVEMPNDDPKTLTGGKKEKFERTLKKENAVLGIAAALKDIKKQN